MGESPKYWFPANNRRLGWGAPSTWQGWALCVGYIVASAIIGLCVGPVSQPIAIGLILVLTVIFIAVLRIKGEPLHWR